MNRSSAMPWRMGKGLIAVTVSCVAMVCALTLNAGTAHALFSMEVHSEISHTVKPFPVELRVESHGDDPRSATIDRDGLTVSVIYSDGSSRTLDDDEYDLSTDELPAGFKGDFEGEASYGEDGHKVSADFTLTVDGAYGAQYGDVLVFGRGIPAVSYEGKGLTSTTWGIEDEGCTPKWTKPDLKSITDIDTVKPVSIVGWFNGSTALQTVELDQLDTSACRSLVSLFNGCTVLSSVQGIGGWDVSHVTDMSWLIYGCRALTTLDIGAWNTSSVTRLVSAFSRVGLTSIDLSKWDVSNLQDAGLMFYDSASVTSVGDLSRWNTSKLMYIGNAFAFCLKLQSVGDIGNWDMSHVVDCCQLFQYCHALSYCGDLSRWNVSNATNFMNLFQWCGSLTTLGDISRWNTGNVTNMDQTFQGCTKLTANCSTWNVSKVTSHRGFNNDGATSVRAPAW